MKSKTRLDSAVFQLTPTRTRYTLVVNAKGEAERISSGLLDPFLAHLNAAQEQFARGYYSIMLEPDHGCEAVWFTKSTVERFVRFVNTPDVLERVNMTESEILHIKDVIATQNSEALGSTNVEDPKAEEYRERSLESIEGSLSIPNVDVENTVVIYTLGDHYINSNGSAGGENSKVQFLRVLETRKNVLQKEQDMAFARAIAAGFDMDYMLQLISFAECFGAPRLMKACLGFMILWEGKHAQWSKTERNEVMPSINNYSILIHEFKKSEAQSDSNGELGIKHNEKESNVAAPDETFDYNRGHDTFCQSLQDMPMSPQDGSVLEKQSSNGQEQWSRIGQEGRHKSGVVAICNISYIGSKGRHDRIGGGSQSTTDRESDKEAKDMDYALKHKQKKSMGSTRRKESKTRPTATGTSYDKEATNHGREADIGKWKVFENILLRHDNEDRQVADQVVFPLENEVFVKRHQNRTGVNQKMVNDGFVIYEQNSWSDYQISNSDPLTQCESVAANKNLRKNSSSNCTDESFILPVRMSSKNQSKADCRAIDMDTGLISGVPMRENVPSRVTSQLLYQPDDLSLIPSRGTSRDSLCYDPAVDYEMETRIKSDINVQKRIKEDSPIGVKEISKTSDKDSTVKGKNGKVLKSSCSTEVHELAERTRSVKPDLQKMKKTKEEEEIKRLEALKSERQRRISARSSSGPVQSTLSSQIRPQPKPKISPTSNKGSTFSTLETQLSPLQGLSNRNASLGSNVAQKIAKQGNLNKATLPQSKLPSHIRPQPQKKILPVAYIGSKFSDSEPGPSSPLQRLRSRAASLRSNASQKISRPGGLNGSDQHALNKSFRSVKSIPELKKGNDLGTSEMKVSTARILRLSDPKISSKSHVSLSKLVTTDSQVKVHTSGVLGMSQPKTSNKDQVSPTKLQNSFLIANPKATQGLGIQMVPGPATGGSGVRMVSRIAPKDRSHVAVLHTKNRSLKSPPSMVQNNTKELALKTNRRSCVSPDATQVQQLNAKRLKSRNGEDKQVIETTVVLENEVPEVNVMEGHGVRIDIRKESNNVHKAGGNLRMVTEDAAFEVPVSAVVVKDVGSSDNSHSDQKAYSPMVTADYAVKELPKYPSSGISSKPDQSPFAHLLSLVESRASHLEYSRAPKCISEVAAKSAEIAEEHASDFSDPSSLEKTPVSILKPCAKVTADYEVKELPKCPTSSVSSKPFQSPLIHLLSLVESRASHLEYSKSPRCISEVAAKSAEIAEEHASDFTDPSSLDKTPGSMLKPRAKVFSKGVRRMLRFGKTTGKSPGESDSFNKCFLVDSRVASTISSNKGKKLGSSVSSSGFRRENMSHALYIV